MNPFFIVEMRENEGSDDLQWQIIKDRKTGFDRKHDVIKAKPY